MSIKLRTARFVARKLIHKKGDVIKPPCADLAVRAREADGREMTIVSRSADVLDIYFAGKRDVLTFSCSRATALRIAWWLLFRWWFLATWCGIKTALWSWSMRIVTNAPKHAA